MNAYLKSTSAFYSGFQKIHVFSEPVLQKALFIIVCKSSLLFALALWTNADKSLAALIIRFLFVLPFMMHMVGGMKAGSMPWYLGMSIFTILGIIPSYKMGLHFSLLFMGPAVYCMYRLHLSAPCILKEFGYLEKTRKATEAIWVVLSASVFILINYFALTKVGGMQFNMQTPAMYLTLFFLCLFDYGILFALLYGMMMRRLLQLGVSLPLVIVANILFFFLNISAEIMGKEDALMAFSALLATSTLTQFVLGLAFYHCRSTRMVFIAYLLNYLIYKSFFMQ